MESTGPGLSYFSVTMRHSNKSTLAPFACTPGMTIYKAAEQQINQGFSLVSRIILGLFSAIFAVILFANASTSERPLAVSIGGIFCICITVTCFTKGRIRQFVGSLIGTAIVAMALEYLYSELFSGQIYSGRRSSPSLVNSIGFLVVFGVPAALYVNRARFGFRRPTVGGASEMIVEVDEVGVRRQARGIREEIKWGEVNEIRIITTSDGPLAEDVFFVLLESDKKGCAIPHDAAVKTNLLEELQKRFPDMDNKKVIEAMGSATNQSFTIWRRPPADQTQSQ
jgi:hypothetical protein